METKIFATASEKRIFTETTFSTPAYIHFRLRENAPRRLRAGTIIKFLLQRGAIVKTSKNRMWTFQDGEDLLEGVTITQLGGVIAKEINKHIKKENELLERIQGFTDCGQPIVVDEYLLEDVLAPENCQKCPCGNYCHKHNMFQKSDCVKVKKWYLIGKLKENATDIEEEEE